LTCGYDLRGSADRCPECGTTKRAAEILAPKISTAVSRPATVASLVLCAALAGLWVLSFDSLQGDQHGTKQLFIANGKLWIGPLFRGGEDAVRSDGWNIGIASWTRSQGVWGGHWTSFSIDLWCFIILFAVPVMVRYRLIHRIREKFHG
jgi:hypothetical protein